LARRLRKRFEGHPASPGLRELKHTFNILVRCELRWARPAGLGEVHAKRDEDGSRRGINLSSDFTPIPRPARLEHVEREATEYLYTEDSRID